MTFIDLNFTVFMNNLRVQGIVLTFDPDWNLVVDAPIGAVNADLLAEIRKYKPEIIKRLRYEPRGSICQHCGTSDYVTVPIHNGQSTRLDCARCGRFLRFGFWYGKELQENNKPIASGE